MGVNQIFKICLEHEMLREKYSLSEENLKKIKLSDNVYPIRARKLLRTLKAALNTGSTPRGFRNEVDEIF